MIIFCAVRDNYSTTFNFNVLKKRAARTGHNGIVYTNTLNDVIALRHRCSRQIGRFREISAFPSVANF